MVYILSGLGAIWWGSISFVYFQLLQSISNYFYVIPGTFKYYKVPGMVYILSGLTAIWVAAYTGISASGQRVQRILYRYLGRVYRSIKWAWWSENYSGLAFRSLNDGLCMAPIEQKAKMLTAKMLQYSKCVCGSKLDFEEEHLWCCGKQSLMLLHSIGMGSTV